MIELDKISNFFSKFVVTNNPQEDNFYLDMHLHTNFSDSNITVSDLKDFLKNKNYLIAVADHNRIQGGIELKENGINVVPAIELGCHDGFEILVYFKNFKNLETFYKDHVQPNLHKTRMSRTNKDIDYYLEVLLTFECYISIPHINGMAQKNFLKNKENIFNIIPLVDGIEVYNHSLPKKNNSRANDLCFIHHKTPTFGSDAHSIREIISYYNFINKNSNFINNILDNLYKINVISRIGYKHLKYMIKKR
ncbi:MAG: PHP domain-containing protein [Fusobacteriaceae bacterium]